MAFSGSAARQDPPHTVLGVSPRATQDQVKQAFLGLAKKYHPDVNPDPSAHEEFVRVQAAYLEMLRNGSSEGYQAPPQSEEVKRDPPPDYRHWNFGDANDDWRYDKWTEGQYGRKHRKTKSHEYADEDFDDFEFENDDEEWEDDFRYSKRRQGKPTTVVLKLTLAEAILGCKKYVDIPNGGLKDRRMEVRIHPGATSNEELHLGRHKNPILIIKLKVQGDDIFKSHGGLDVGVVIPISICQAVWGADVYVPSLSGPALSVHVPPGTKPGDYLVLQGQGLRSPGRRSRSGNLRVTWAIQIPNESSMTSRQRAALREFASDEAIDNSPLRHSPGHGAQGDHRPKHRKEKARRRR